MDPMTNPRNQRRSQSAESGFTLVETLIAMVILTGGLLALAAAFSQGMVVMSTSHYHQIAEAKAAEAIESVFTSRDTRIITWAQIRNVSAGGVFLDGAQPLRASGADGLVNTADDGTLECETLPGPDGVLGTGDDVVRQLTAFTREIAIVDLAPNLRQIRVIVRYQIGSLNRQYQLTAYISSFA
jgi:prepilin-type N-terminal cleavage/methylation domain-containing protein